MCFSETSQLLVTDDIFKVMGSEVKVTNNIFENAYIRWRQTNQWFAVKDHFVAVMGKQDHLLISGCGVPAP